MKAENNEAETVMSSKQFTHIHVHTNTQTHMQEE